MWKGFVVFQTSCQSLYSTASSSWWNFHTKPGSVTFPLTSLSSVENTAKSTVFPGLMVELGELLTRAQTKSYLTSPTESVSMIFLQTFLQP